MPKDNYLSLENTYFLFSLDLTLVFQLILADADWFFRPVRELSLHLQAYIYVKLNMDCKPRLCHWNLDIVRYFELKRCQYFALNPSFFERGRWVSVTETWNAWTLLERQRLQTPMQIAVVLFPLCLAPGRPECHLENEVHYLQIVKKKTSGTCGGRDKASTADGDLVSCINLGKTSSSVQDWCNTLDDCMRYYTHCPNRPWGG